MSVEAYLYIVAASGPLSDQGIQCNVPFRLGPDEVFFGPCKKSLRAQWRREWLQREALASARPPSRTLMVGFNASNSDRQRRVVWAGEVREAMTFAEAHRRMGDHPRLDPAVVEGTPLHVEPIEEDGVLVGYRHRVNSGRSGRMHHSDWHMDLVDRHTSRKWTHTADEVRLSSALVQRVKKEAKRGSAFPRDLCVSLSNLHYDTGDNSLEIDAELVDILRQAQGGAQSVDSYAIFGRTEAGHVDGRRGRWLHMSGEPAARLDAWLRARGNPGHHASDGAVARRARRC